LRRSFPSPATLARHPVELDRRLEAAAAAEFAQNFADHPSFHLPTVDWQRTNRIMAIAAEAFFRQVFVDGFFHADMHPGNVFTQANSSSTVGGFRPHGAAQSARAGLYG